MRRRLLITCVALAGASACKADNSDSGIDKQPDAGSDALPAPTIEAPGASPLGTVALRGSASEAARVVVKPVDGLTSQVESLLPGGRFCVDAPLATGAATSFLIYAVAEDGRISAPAEVTVTQDDGAELPTMATCTESASCADAEVCDNEDDDDCNGYADACDPGCNGCVDDFLEPNDTPFEVPQLTESMNPGLTLCPCSDDWYAFPLAANQRLLVRASFVHAEVDLDLRLYEATAAENQGASVKSSLSVTNSEEIDYTPTAAGVYYLRAYSIKADAQGGYALTVP